MEKEKVEEVPGIPEGEVSGIQVSVALPNGTVKSNGWLNYESTVGQEKERLLSEARIPSPSNYVMVICNQTDNSSRQMKDDDDMDDYISGLSDNSLVEIKPANSANLERPGRPCNPSTLNVNMRK